MKLTKDEFGLNYCLRETMDEIEQLVTNGIYDHETKKNIQVRVICSLGTVFKFTKKFQDMYFYFKSNTGRKRVSLYLRGRAGRHLFLELLIRTLCRR